MWRDIPIDSVSLASFAPSVESVTITFNPSYHGPSRRLELSVSDRHGNQVFVAKFRHKRHVNKTSYDWGGERTRRRGFVDPLGSPYTIALRAEVPDAGRMYSAYLHLREGGRGGVSSLRGYLPALIGDRLLSPLTRQVEVHYHSIALTLGEFLPADEAATLDGIVQGRAPGYGGIPGPDRALWVWYKLSSMGYPAGPRTDSVTPALGAAILKYRQAHPDLYRKLHEKIGDNDYSIRRQEQDAASKIDAALIKALVAGDNNRLDRGHPAPGNILDELDVFSDENVDSRLFVDVERFYIGTNTEFNARRKFAVDALWCPRPRVPVRATVYLRDSTGARVDNLREPSALGDFRVRWVWSDIDQHAYRLPFHSASQPSRTRAYIRRARAQAARLVPSPFKNAREAVGGLVSGDDRRDAQAPFAACEPYGLTLRDDGVETAPGGADASTVGATQVYLHPSIIAGDTYSLRASLVTAGLAPQPSPARLVAETGVLEIWRRIRIDAALRWTTAAAFAGWDAVKNHFRAANLEILGPEQALEVANLPAQARAVLQGAVEAKFVADKVWSRDPARDWLAFSDDHAYPQSPVALEFELMAAHGTAQFTSPANIINELMIWSLQDDFEAWRKDDSKQPTDALRRRSDVLALWTACGGWRQAVAAHFRVAIDLIFDTGTNTCRGGLRPGLRVIEPLPHGLVGGLPASRADILHLLLMDPIEAQLAAHRAGNPANIAEIRTLRVFVQQAERDARTTDETRKIPMHPLLRQALLFYIQAFEDLGAGMQYALHPYDLEIRVQGVLPAVNPISAALTGQPHQASNVVRTAPANKEITFLRVTLPTRDTFDFPAFQVTYPRCHSVLFLRGTQATAPQFTISAEKEAELDKRQRIRLARHQRSVVCATLTEVFNTLMPQLVDAIEDTVRTPLLPALTRPRSGVIVVQYSAHPGPVAVETGSPIDRASITNATACGLDTGICFIPDQLPLDRAHLVAHELSHCMFLRHWQTTHEVIKDGFSYPDEHDRADANCIMSYSAWEQSIHEGPRAPCDTHFRVDRYRPHFCGKCNLALRGWNLEAQHLGRPFLPERSIDQELVNPDIAYAPVTPPEVPAPALLQAQAIDMIANVLHAPVGHATMVLDGATLRFLGNPTLVKHGGAQLFRWSPLGATPFGGGQALPAGGPAYDIPDAGLKTDDEILRGPNSTYGCAWEKHLEFFKMSGGATNVPRDIIFNTHNFLFTPDTPIHEVIHVYQQWDAAVVHEGITELFGLMLAHHLKQADPGNAPQYMMTLNPTYMQATIFAVDELLPRLGLTGLARLYFGEETAVLEKALITGKSTGAFNDACKAGMDAYDMTVAALTLVPVAKRPPVDTTHDAGAAAHLAYATGEIDQYLANNNQQGYGPGERARHAKRIRLDAKIRAYDDGLTQATTYRAQQTDQERIHRLEAWIDETSLQLAAMRDEL